MMPPDAGKSEDSHSPAHDLRPSMLRPVSMTPPVSMIPPDAGKSEDGHSPAHGLRPSMPSPGAGKSEVRCCLSFHKKTDDVLYTHRPLNGI